MINFLKLDYRNLLLVILFFPTLLFGQDQSQEKILFVGNSYTYFWNLPQVVNSMGTSIDHDLMTRQSTAGGASLKDHWNRNKGLVSRATISDNSWDYVVIQNHSMSAINNKAEFHQYGTEMIELVKSKDAHPILYITWAREFNPLMQSAINSEYMKLAASSKVDAIPVGPIWDIVKKLRPDLKLYDPDGSHPSPIGTYLTGLIFTKYFTKKDTKDIPSRLINKDSNQEKLYLLILPANDADFLQQVVDSFDFKPYLRNG